MRIVFCFAFVVWARLSAQTITVTPAQVLVDEPATIHVTGGHPGERLTLRAELVDGAGGRWISKSEFTADPEGNIDTSKQAPTAGSYKEISAMGPIWSMKPSGSNEGRYQPPRDFGMQTIELRLLRGGTVVSTAQLEQTPVADGVRRIPVHDSALRGILFAPPGNGPHPAILVLGGSEGGAPSRRAAWFASYGYAALALAYFRFDDLPRELRGIPLEYFGQALDWMAHRPEIDPSRIAVSGGSRGGELALQIGSMYPIIKAVVAYVPADVRYPACCGFRLFSAAWTWQGRDLTFARPGRGRMAGAAQAIIPVENIRGPILLISGSDDHVWNSSEMSDSVVARLKHGHFPYEVVHLNYPHAGHGAGHPEIVPAWQGWVINPTSGRETEMGGTPKGNAESALDAAPKVLAFLKTSLPAR